MPAAYQDENGKWYKQCSKTKEVFGPVDNKEDLSVWFVKSRYKKDGFHCHSKQTNKQFRQQNKNKIYERVKRYREENKNKLYQQRKKDREKRIHKIKQYNIENKDKIKKQKKQYNQTATGFLTRYKSKAKKRSINFTLTLEWFEQQITKPEFNVCAISGKQFVEANGNPNEPFARSLDRIDSTKGYTPDNVAWVCFRYNSWKCDLSHEEIKMIYEYSSKHNSVSSTT